MIRFRLTCKKFLDGHESWTVEYRTTRNIIDLLLGVPAWRHTSTFFDTFGFTGGEIYPTRAKALEEIDRYLEEVSRGTIVSVTTEYIVK